MIVSVLVGLVFIIIHAIIALLGAIPSFPAEFLQGILTYLQQIINFGSGLFFFLIRPTTFRIAVDILFFVWVAEPLYHFIMWVIRKIPFANIE